MTDADLAAEVVEVRLAALENWRDDCDAAGLDPTPARDTYPDVDTFVRDELAPTYLRFPPLGGPQLWCPNWRDHPEAAARLRALWRAWEHLVGDTATGTGESTWQRDHLDHHLPLITSRAGPFAACTNGHREPYAAVDTGVP